jgi:hypothetical protein
MSREDFLHSLEETEFDYYKNIKVPLFAIPGTRDITWSSVTLEFRVELPCPVRRSGAAVSWVNLSEHWSFHQSKTGSLVTKINDATYLLAA